ncbi:MAG: Gfo/Idh/MocA family protein [Terrimicrobiaceae bacterium]
MKSPLRIAIAGFRHAHIFDLLGRVEASPGLTLAAMCEENREESLMPSKNLKPSHTDFDAMLADVDCDIVALGDCYGKRGSQAIRALRAGRHVIADKPLCTSLDELDEIESLTREKNLCIGMMLDLRDHGNLIALRGIVKSGRIGEVQTVTFSAQHPLLWGRRPAWYFEPGMHGGTLNDIAIHAMDFLPWMTGLDLAEVVAARTWNAKATEAFKDCGQFLLRLSNGGGVLGDVSYLAPDQCGFSADNYWRITLHGTRGFAETSYNRPGITVADDTSAEPEIIAPAAPRPGGYLEDFLADVSGNPRAEGLDTASCLRATRMALELESAAAQQSKI